MDSSESAFSIISSLKENIFTANKNESLKNGVKHLVANVRDEAVLTKIVNFLIEQSDTTMDENK